ncbi:hypothetical protein PhCBS80983_g01263 [Powellomyces hirtus]|uniref:Rho-GAP domain-containing protein n=1 Tax=Powellomyces hirtus TaxID=109895 RepID=A0A507EBM7_9FUNG|nr:hypothetical protein PhCBS80983_g01263 [Powellomyces hirtus]
MYNATRRPKSACWDTPPTSLSLPRNTGPLHRGYTTSSSMAHLDSTSHPAAAATITPLSTPEQKQQWRLSSKSDDQRDLDPKVSIPTRLDSKDPLNAKRYSELTPSELEALSLAALKRLNAVFKHYKIRTLPHNVLKTIAADTAGQGKTKRFLWWKPWAGGGKPNSKKEDAARDPETVASVLALHLVRSIQVASVPRDSQPDITNNRRIPVVISECVKYIKDHGLDTTGLFRVNGSERRMNQLAVLFDTPPTYGLGVSFEGNNVYDVAGFVKRYLRIIPEPVLTTELYPSFLRCLDVPAEGGTRIRAFRLLLMLLPPAHLVLLETILELMVDIVAHSEANQMTAHSLARIISPNILRPRESTAKKQGLEEYERGSYVMEYLIDNWQHFGITDWSVMPFQMLDLGFANVRDPITSQCGPSVLVTVEQPLSVNDDMDRNSGTVLMQATIDDRALHPDPHCIVDEPPAMQQQVLLEGRPMTDSPQPPFVSLATGSDSGLSGKESRDSMLSGSGSSSSMQRQCAPDGQRLRRVRTAPTKRSRGGPRRETSRDHTGSSTARLPLGNSSSSALAVELPHTASSQSLQSLDHYTHHQLLRRQASQLRQQQQHQQQQQSSLMTGVLQEQLQPPQLPSRPPPQPHQSPPPSPAPSPSPSPPPTLPSSPSPSPSSSSSPPLASKLTRKSRIQPPPLPYAITRQSSKQSTTTSSPSSPSAASPLVPLSRPMPLGGDTDPNYTPRDLAQLDLAAREVKTRHYPL